MLIIYTRQVLNTLLCRLPRVSLCKSPKIGWHKFSISKVNKTKKNVFLIGKMKQGGILLETCSQAARANGAEGHHFHAMLISLHQSLQELVGSRLCTSQVTQSSSVSDLDADQS